MKIGLLQLNLKIGDFESNFKLLESAVRKAAAKGAELCVAPELTTCGYPPHDLVFQEGFAEKNLQFAERVKELTTSINCGVLFGLVTPNQKEWGKPLHNSAMLVAMFLLLVPLMT